MAFYAVWDQSPRFPVFPMQFPLTPHKPTRDTCIYFQFVKYRFDNKKLQFAPPLPRLEAYSSKNSPVRAEVV